MSDSFKYFISVFLYGTMGYFLSLIDVSGEFTVLVRGGLGSLFVLLIMFFRKQKIDSEGIKKNILFLILSGISLGLNETFLFMGYKYAVSLTSLGNYTAPISVIVISALFLKEKISFKQALCIVCSFVGVLCLSGIFTESNVDITGLIYGLLASIGFVALVFFNKKLEDIDPYDKTFMQLAFSFLTVLPFALINKSIPPSFDLKMILVLTMLGTIHTGFAYILYFDAIKTLSPVYIATIGYVEPVMSVLTGALLLSEPMNIYSVIGAILIIGSACVCQLVSDKSV